MSWQTSNCHLDKVTKLLFQAEALCLIDERTALRTSAFSANLTYHIIMNQSKSERINFISRSNVVLCLITVSLSYWQCLTVIVWLVHHCCVIQHDVKDL